jgi:hypothetical protein
MEFGASTAKAKKIRLHAAKEEEVIALEGFFAMNLLHKP